MTLIFWLQFAAVCIAGAISPGPSLALIIRNSIKYNRLSGIITAVGHGLGMGIYAGERIKDDLDRESYNYLQECMVENGSAHALDLGGDVGILELLGSDFELPISIDLYLERIN